MTTIEWTDDTWNPIVGCSVVSPGCTNCYAMSQAARLLDGNSKAPHYAGTTKRVNGHAVWTGKVAMAPRHILTAPLRWKKPRRIFVNSMGDLFHENVPDAWIDKVFAVMALAPQHTFQVLTKRSRRMREYCNNPATVRRVFELVCDLAVEDGLNVTLIAPGHDSPFVTESPAIYLGQWPLTNAHLGVSAEDQERADERIPDLLNTLAAVRFVSAEPLLGPWSPMGTAGVSGAMLQLNCLYSSPKLDWVIVGGVARPRTSSSKLVGDQSTNEKAGKGVSQLQRLH